MTKENSTKPAFVSEETGPGDGFLAAPHVWESSAFPPCTAAAAAAAAPTNETPQPGGQRTERPRQITPKMTDWRSGFDTGT